MSTSPSKINPWVRVLAGTIMNIMLGSVYSWSVFRGEFESAFGWTTTQSGVPYTLLLALFAFTMPIGGIIMKKIGLRSTSLIGTTLLGGAWILVGAAQNPTVTILGYGILGGIGVGISYGVSVNLAASWLPGRRGLAIGASLLGFGMSPLVTAPIAANLISTMGVFDTFFWMGLFFPALILLLSIFIRYPRTGEAKQPVKSKTHAEYHDVRPKVMFRSKKFWGLYLPFVMATGAGLTAIGLTSPMAQELAGFSFEAAAVLVSVLAILNGIGRPIFGAFTDAKGFRAGALFATALMIAGSALGYVSPGSPILFTLAIALFWFAFGSWLAVAPTATSQLFGHSFYSTNYGIVYTGYGIGALFGNLSGGQVASLTGSYRGVFLLLGAIASLGFLIAFFVLKAKKQARQVAN